MAKIFSNSDGRLIAIYDTAGLAQYGAPVEAVYSLEFDEASNADLWEDFKFNYLSYSLIGTSLTKNEQPVTITPPTEEHIAQTSAASGYAVLPDWVRTGTADQAETKINNDFSLPTVGSLENAKLFINANLLDIPSTVTNVSQLRTAMNARLGITRTILNAMVDLFIVERDYYIFLAKLLIYLRDNPNVRFKR